MSSRAYVLLSLLVPALAGCGGGSDERAGSKSSTSSEPRLDQAQFVSRANKVCIDADRRVFRIGELTPAPADWDRTERAAHRGIVEMQRLNPPAELERGFRRMLKLAAGLEREVGAVGDALRKQRIARAQAAQLRATNFDTQVKRQAQKLGLTFCSQLLTNWPA